MAPSGIKGGTRAMRLVQFLVLSSCAAYNMIRSSDSLHGACEIHVERIFQLLQLWPDNDSNTVDVAAVL